MVLKINGVDILPYIADSGIKWQRNDIEAPDAGRTLDSDMHRNRIGIKIRLDITCRPLSTAEARAVMSAILPEYVTVQYEDLIYGMRTTQMYSNNVPAVCGTVYPDGDALWEDLSFPLIEV